MASPPLSYCTPRALSHRLSWLCTLSLLCALSNLLYSSSQPPTLFPLSSPHVPAFLPFRCPSLPSLKSPPAFILSLPCTLFYLPHLLLPPPVTEITALAPSHWGGNLRCIVNAWRESSCQCWNHYLSTMWNHLLSLIWNLWSLHDGLVKPLIVCAFQFAAKWHASTREWFSLLKWFTASGSTQTCNKPFDLHETESLDIQYYSSKGL